MRPSRFPVLIALLLLVISSALAACSNEEPAPTATPPEETPTPEATPTPGDEVPEDIVEEARGALDALESTRFSFSRTPDDAEGEGEWLASGRFFVTTSLAMCPPSVPGGPELTDCEMVPWYQVVRVGESMYAAPAGNDDWEETESSPVGLSLLNEGGGLADMLDAVTGSGQEYEVYRVRNSSGVVTDLHIISESPSVSYILELDPETYLPIELSVTNEDGSEWNWTFSDHDADIDIERPV
ncbi:MAG: hypothetical protein WD533_06855 [Dehalococcoidia bacterium]